MTSPVSGIDHVIIAVGDLERARLAWDGADLAGQVQGLLVA